MLSLKTDLPEDRIQVSDTKLISFLFSLLYWKKRVMSMCFRLKYQYIVTWCNSGNTCYLLVRRLLTSLRLPKILIPICKNVVKCTVRFSVCMCVCLCLYVFVRALTRAKPWRLSSRKYVFESEAPNIKVYGYNTDEARNNLCISSKQELHDSYR